MNMFDCDIVIGYSNGKDLAEIAIPLKNRLERENVLALTLNVNNGACQDAIHYSRIFIPILTDHYLARPGALEELDSGVNRRIRERRTRPFTFYPIIPIVKDRRDIIRRGSWPAHYERIFDWLINHVFHVSWGYGVDWLVRFFKSLVLTAKNEPDAEFLNCLFSVDEVCRGARLTFYPYEENPMVRILLKHPVLTYYTYMMSSEGDIGFIGLGEADDDSFEADRMKNPVELIVKHMWGELKFDSERRPIIGNDKWKPDESEQFKNVDSKAGPRFVPALFIDDEIVSLETDWMATRLLVRGKKHVALYDLEKGRQLFFLQESIALATFSGDGNHILMSNPPGLSLLDMDGNEAIRVAEPESSKAGWSGDGKRLVVGHFNDVHFLDPATLEKKYPLQDRVPSLLSLTLSNDGSMLIIGNSYNMALWDGVGDLIGAPRSEACYSGLFDDKRGVCIGSFFDGCVVAFDLDTLRPVKRIELEGPVMQLYRLSPDKLLLRHCTREKRPDSRIAFRVWDMEKDHLSEKIVETDPSACQAAVAPGAGMIISSVERGLLSTYLVPEE